MKIRAKVSDNSNCKKLSQALIYWSSYLNKLLKLEILLGTAYANAAVTEMKPL